MRPLPFTQWENKINTAFILGGCSVFLLVVARILYRRRSILKPIFFLVALAIVAGYVALYRRFFRAK